MLLPKFFFQCVTLRIQAGDICFNTHDTYSFPTVRKDLTLRLQFRFFNMNHRKPALIQWKVATRCVVDRQSNEPHFLSPYGEGLTNANAIFAASLTQLFRQVAPREKHTIAQTRPRTEYSSDRSRNKARTEWCMVLHLRHSVLYILGDGFVGFDLDVLFFEVTRI